MQLTADLVIMLNINPVMSSPKGKYVMQKALRRIAHRDRRMRVGTYHRLFQFKTIVIVKLLSLISRFTYSVRILMKTSTVLHNGCRRQAVEYVNAWLVSCLFSGMGGCQIQVR